MEAEALNTTVFTTKSSRLATKLGKSLPNFQEYFLTLGRRKSMKVFSFVETMLLISFLPLVEEVSLTVQKLSPSEQKPIKTSEKLFTSIEKKQKKLFLWERFLQCLPRVQK
jgi:hypothetical protein